MATVESQLNLAVVRGCAPNTPSAKVVPVRLLTGGKIAVRLRVGCAQISTLDSRSMNKHPVDFAVVCDVPASGKTGKCIGKSVVVTARFVRGDSADFRHLVQN